MAEADNWPEAEVHPGSIAIIGMAGRFPGAPDIDTFWQNLKSGTISITHFADDDLKDSFDKATRSAPNFVRARGVLENPGMFDADLFGMFKREAELTDPQHRVFLELSLQALEQAAIDPKRFAGPIGVFAGASMPTYLINNVMGDRAAAADFASNYQLGGMETLVGSLPETLASRVAYKLDLRGPALTVQSACSTSALAVSQACQSLMLYQCDAALAGGVSITFPQERGYLYLDGGMGSRDGTCRPFDAAACGTVFGSGAGVVALKRLEDALADGDFIHAVIRGFGVSNDGGDKIGFTAPSAGGQASAIAAALANANVDPDTIGYVELHGTATPLGDPIEFDGLLQAFGDECMDENCALGSAKANIGHLDAAAGVTGLIKAALSVQHGEIPPLANFSAPNPNIHLGGSPFRIETELQPWSDSGGPRRAGVSSFGVGGTNVHFVLEQAPVRTRMATRAAIQILPFSAKKPESLAEQAEVLADYFESHPDLDIADVARTLTEGRSERKERGAVVAETLAEAADKLRKFAKRGLKGTAASSPPMVFMFPGQGSQYPGMGRNLYHTEAVFREWIDRGAEALLPEMGQDIRKLLYDNMPQDDETPHPIRSTVFAQPALFITQYALAQLWISRGIRPSTMIGHSVGELVAASLAGAMTFEDGLMLVARRASLMQSAPAGAMLSVRASEAEVLPLLTPNVDLAAVNAPKLSVVAGPFEAIEQFEAALAKANIECRRLHTSHAFHSAMMEPVVEALRDVAAKIPFAAPKIPYLSCVTAEWADNTEPTSGSYWAQHCRAPVRFAEALATLVTDGNPILLEVGAGRTLSTFAAQGLARDSYTAAITSMPDFAEADSDVASFYEAMARLWTLGAAPDWSAQYGSNAQHVPLPAYQFQRKNFWIEAPDRPDHTAVQAHVPQVASPVPISAKDIGIDMTQTPISIEGEPHRGPRLCLELAEVFASLSGEDIEQGDWATEFTELGFDSLFLGQVATAIQRKYSVKVTFRQLLGDFPTISAVADHLDELLPPEVAEPTPVPAAAPAPEMAPPLPGVPLPMQQGVAATTVDGNMGAIFQLQINAMQNLIEQQMAFMRGSSEAAQPAANASVLSAPTAEGSPREDAPAAESARADGQSEPQGRFRPFKPSGAQANSGITDAQKTFIAELTERYCAKMPTSKAQTQRHRSYFSDPRSASGFRQEWKEMVFPVVAERSKGSKIWDVDGNEFVDLVNGYGQTAFGHAPDFVQEAVSRQMEQGFAIGPQTPVAGEVAQKFARFVGLERVTFCNTGSEAVMAAMRVARCVTGRETVVVFNNDYHGQFDEVLVKAGRSITAPRALPLAPGIPFDSVANMVVLPYGNPQALDWIRANTGDIAAVIVEPVQSRHPELVPVEFLRELRSITEAAETAFVFDEVVTGFRTHPGGMQALLGIRADMATYGKVVGGGLPIGVLAGSARFLDALDGGDWQFGDDSFPEVAPTFFAGTFVRHPLVMAACNAVLDHLDMAGPQLQIDLAARNSGLVDRLNAVFVSKGVPSKIESYSSWFMVDLSHADRLGGLFYYQMRLRSVHIIDGYPCFLTTAHSDADIDQIVRATADSIDALQSVGILLPEGASIPQPSVAATPPREVPLTEPQLEILLSAQMGPQASCAYNESMALTFDGMIDPAALVRAVQSFAARHDAMRGTIKAGEPVLVIAPDMAITIPVTESASDADLAAAKAEEASTPFDLVEGPLLRARLLQMEHGNSALVVTAHHIIFDGWTANIFAQEIAEFYRAEKSGHAPTLDPALSFADYALGKTAEGEAERKAEAYWLDRFSTVPTPLALPGDRPRPAIKSFNGATITDIIDADLTRELRAAGGKLGCTMFATLLGAMQVLVGRLANHDDVVIGCPMAGQTLIDDEVLAGHCVNFLPLRAPFAEDQSLGDHLKVAKTALMEALKNQDYTYGSLVRALKQPRNLNRTPLTDVQFNLERLGEGIDFGGVTADLVPNPKAAVNFDLFFNMVESSKGLRVDLDYNTDLFDPATIKRWIENLRQVLRAIASDATQTIGDVDILGAEERAWLETRNPATPRLADECSILHSFAKAAQRHSGSVAIADGGESLTYAELDGRSNRIANALMARGVRKGDRVALLAGRSHKTLILILGIIKAGAVYVPLDPVYPAARLAYMFKDSAAKLILIGPDGGDAVGQFDLTSSGVTFDALFADAASQSANAPQVKLAADDPAYVMYTSGSTGQPKGVIAAHRGVVRLVSDQSYIAFGPDQTFLHHSALAFDASTLEIWGALLHGGKIAVISEAKPSLDQIAETILTHGVTSAWFTAALFHAIIDERMAALAPLQQILAGGDVLSPEHVGKVLQAFPGVRVVNGYGPTENTTFTACYVFPAEGWGPGPAPIGMPLAHSSVKLLDARGRLLPQGAIGELFAGGEGLSLGYVDAPELTAERFIEDPGQPGKRLYRTGDLARWRQDGSLEFAGRADSQVKINGQRVELGEIESALRRRPGVRDAAVIVLISADGTKNLHAFITKDPLVASVDFSIEALEKQLHGELPAYMHPKTVQMVEALMRNANGKVDRSALEEIVSSQPTLAVRARKKPRLLEMNGLEEKLAEIWTDVLGIESVSRDDAIFDLGADSLQIFRISARMSDQGLTIENRQLLANPTLGEVAAILARSPKNDEVTRPAMAPLASYRRGAPREVEA